MYHKTEIGDDELLEIILDINNSFNHKKHSCSLFSNCGSKNTECDVLEN